MAWLPFKKILLEQMFQSKSHVGTFISDVPKVELDSSEHSGEEGLQNPLPWCAWRNSDILHVIQEKKTTNAQHIKFFLRSLKILKTLNNGLILNLNGALFSCCPEL